MRNAIRRVHLSAMLAMAGLTGAVVLADDANERCDHPGGGGYLIFDVMR